MATRMAVRILAVGTVALVLPAFTTVPLQEAPQMAGGTVFEDRNGNGVQDRGEPGIPGVFVSNQHDFAKTDRNGRWRLVASDDTIFFVVKPRGFETPVDEHNLPRFYYIHKPKGSPPSKYPGVAPTGPLPKEIDFPLRRRAEPQRFAVLFFGDTQPRDLREVDYLTRDIVEPLIGHHDAKFGVTLGDIAYDDLRTFEPLAASIALLGIPWYNVLGNHDMNYDADHDQQSDETFERVFGPNYYSFDYGPTHFVVLDDVVWQGARTQPDNRGRYKAGLGKDQLAWLAKDLANVPPNQLVVLMMHIPINEIEEREALYRLLETRPFALSVSAHTHYQEHRFLTRGDGWRGREPHHHVVNVTTSGSWWQGAPDENGIPHTTMRCGAPNGYAIFTFDGHQYSIEFRAARRPATYQMQIEAPDSVPAREAAGTPIYANVFGGSERSQVLWRLGKGAFQPMTKVAEHDPAYVRMYERDKALQAPFRPLPAPIASPHLWKAVLPRGLRRGTVVIEVTTRDMFGQTYASSRAIRIE